MEIAGFIWKIQWLYEIIACNEDSYILQSYNIYNN